MNRAPATANSVPREAGRGLRPDPRISPAVGAFDRLADRYDALTAGELFGAMRGAAQTWLAEAFPAGAHVLDVGCGTGADTAFLAARGVDVVAIDPSAEMIARARARIDRLAPPGCVRFVCAGVEEVAEHLPARLRVDGIVSSFGALNCLATLDPFAALAHARVLPGGRLIVGVMSRICLAELAWFGLRGQFRRAGRRLGRAPVPVDVAGIAVPTHYHRVGDLQRALAPAFRLVRLRALGLVLPPYAEARWRTWPRALRRAVARVDAGLAPLAPFNRVGDHVLMEFVRCP
jgi:SAM-dependent methyltransferase